MAAVSAAAALMYPSNAIFRTSFWSSKTSKALASHGKQELRLAAAVWPTCGGRGRNVARASSPRKTEVELPEEEKKSEGKEQERIPTPTTLSAPSPGLQKELNKAVTKTAATFAPRASTASRNPAVPGSTLYQIFEVQAYISMAVGGLLSYNLLFPSDQADIWRLMGMWSVWMFTIPSLRARDCAKKEKDALNYLFLLIPLINVTLPLFWKSFAAVWSADIVAFFAMYAWKMGWFSDVTKADD